MIVALVEADDLVAPAQIDLRQFAGAIDEKGFGVILLQIDEGRHLVAVFRQQVEAVEHVIVQEDLADFPHDAFLHHPFADPETVPQFQRTFRETDRARTVADPIGVIQQDDKADLIEKPLPLPKPSKQDGIRQQLGIDESIHFELVEEAVAAVEQAESKQDLERLRGGWQHFEGIDAETIANAYEDKLVSLEDNDAT